MLDKLVNLMWWIVNKLLFIFTNTDMWKHWLIEDGWLWIIIGGVLLIVTTIWLINWLTKYWPFNQIYLSPPNEKLRQRFLGRKIIKFDRGDYWYNKKIPDDVQDKFKALIYYYNGGLNRFLIPKIERRTVEKRFKWTKIDINVYFKGMKYNSDISCRIASNTPVQTEVTNEEFFYSDARDKMQRTDDFGEIAVRSNAESQFIQMDRGSIPITEADYPQFDDEEIAEMRLEGEGMQMDKHTEEEIEEEMKRLRDYKSDHDTDQDEKNISEKKDDGDSEEKSLEEVKKEMDEELK